MSDWPIIVSSLLAGSAAGMLVAQGLWQHTLKHGTPPKWLPAALAGRCFGDVPKAQQEVNRSKLENQNLRRELRQLSSLLNLATLPVWRRDSNLMVQYCNLTYTLMLEDVPERILEEYGMELSQHGRKLAEKAVNDKCVATESRHIVIEGERRQYEIVEIPDPDLGGTVGFAVDTTAHEVAEEELRRHNRAHADLLEASNMATAIFDGQRRLKFYNRAFLSLWRMDKRWLDSEPDYLEIIEHLREKRRLPEMANFQLYRQQRLKLFTDLMEPHEEIMHLPDGCIVRLLVIPHALGGLIFSFEDVTDKLALERSYNTLIAVQRETLNHLHEGVAVFGEDGRLRLSNPVYQKLWGLESSFLESEPHAAEILEHTKSYYIYDDWESHKEQLASRLHARKMHYERLERSDGTVLDWSTIPLPDGATLVNYIDVTDSTLVERSLIDKNEALREADRLKTEFLLSVSYELRSPLTSITGFAEILKEGYFGKLNDRQGEYVSGIYDSATQLGQLINNILDLASVEAGYMRLEVSDCDVANVLQQAHDAYAAAAKERGIGLEVQCEKSIGSIQADRERVRQILLNLLSNAIKFTPENGRIVLGARDAQDGNIVLWVKDTGAGIPEEDLRSVFERFRAGAVRTQRSGAGLGLAMVKNFVELHGGRVELESEAGKGTCVSCYIPREHPLHFVPEDKAAFNSGSPLAKAAAAKKQRDDTQNKQVVLDGAVSGLRQGGAVEGDAVVGAGADASHVEGAALENVAGEKTAQVKAPVKKTDTKKTGVKKSDAEKKDARKTAGKTTDAKRTPVKKASVKAQGAKTKAGKTSSGKTGVAKKPVAIKTRV